MTQPQPVLAMADDTKNVQQTKEQAAIAELEAALLPKFSGKECETELDVLAAKSFAYVHPEFQQKVKDGFNIIVAGTAFVSCLSREEAAICLKAVCVQGVIAKSFAYIYARNQPNNALLGIVVTDEKFHELANEGEEVTCVENSQESTAMSTMAPSPVSSTPSRSSHRWGR
ncbi:hypothetical protein PF005_g9312 [Phytophthora fragariae]|uniref:Aconitase A/isopropylmalate dehydratase small subunit swivel domain-containing protein n=1 Tax=Phytophthora fragariae TaxID=53985 RepID=A0A6A3TZN9_9STRA|nr:hypothetical protein PF003_g12192 [Phytophthora fragariae]KAE8939857.1 hypothetical protein PF009_g10303 [Phytophthora fragariae]KAE9117128.1 hypothetical protein PF007_g9395 [Phytophthora fragariae]KAE9143838.1 hypothetical protein PF006_g11159 [Phytophthora fragariae]KAE9214696.1 hypothetical protein PF002_g17586 [Phytophthora fragariae]